MRCVFEASNAVEAHMVLHMLEQSDIVGRIEGEHLPGALGELPAMRLVRVVVEEPDFERARSIIAEWEKPLPQDAPSPDAAPRMPAAAKTAAVFLFGAIVGGGGVFWVLNSPVSERGADYNGDGRLDETFFYHGSLLSRIEQDRNGDGRVDGIVENDLRGMMRRYRSDDDFDGSFEGTTSYRNGQPILYEYDRNGDGLADVRYLFADGVAHSTEYLDAHSGSVVKREYFKGRRLLRDEFDTDRDGTLETHRTYDELAEIVSTSRE